MFSKILVPLDGSKMAEKALPYARHVGRQNNAEIVLALICPVAWIVGSLSAMGGYPVPEEFTEEEIRLHKDYLAGLQAEIEADGLKAVCHCYQGEPAMEILDLAEKEACDLIIMTSHGRSGPSRFFIGSVAEKLARHSPCPVMIVGHRSIKASETWD